MLGIFIEPQGELKNFIEKWKKKFKEKDRNSKYLNHPPHLSIYVANLLNQKKIILEIQSITSNFQSFKINIDKINIFYNDALTNKDTIFLSVKKNKKIFNLQRKLALKLRKFVKHKKNKRIKLDSYKLKNSMDKYGYPFIGSHWIPHFTIGSIKNLKNKNEYKILLKNKIKFRNNIDKISLWKINGDKHKKIKEFKLNKYGS